MPLDSNKNAQIKNGFCKLTVDFCSTNQKWFYLVFELCLAQLKLKRDHPNRWRSGRGSSPEFKDGFDPHLDELGMASNGVDHPCGGELRVLLGRTEQGRSWNSGEANDRRRKRNLAVRIVGCFVRFRCLWTPILDGDGLTRGWATSWCSCRPMTWSEWPGPKMNVDGRVCRVDGRKWSGRERKL